MLYQLIFRLFLSRMNPETAHHLGMFSIKAASNLGLLKLLKNKKHSISALGLEFTGPFGVAAGFDKNGEAVKALGQLGFSHVEIGTVTAVSQPGNEKPRLFRLKADRALINRMGFNNDGAQLVAKRLEKLRKSNSKLPVIGVNIGKSKITAVEDAVSDYQISAKLLAPWADYLAVNVSSPNTPGLRSLQDVKALEPILVAVLKESLAKPVLVKIAPDLSDEDILEIAKLAKSLGLAGVIATNTTIARDNLKTDKQKVLAMGAGGLSGPVLNQRSLEVLTLLRKTLGQDLAIISVGGIETQEQVTQRLNAGANLVQGYTGFIYFGPFWGRKLNGN